MRRDVVVGRALAAVVVAAVVVPSACLAADVRVVGITQGRSAAVVIDGGAPISMDVGATVGTVTLLRVDGQSAVLKVDGVTKTLPLVAAEPGHAVAAGSTVTLAADANGHFVTTGAVNGRAVRFIVDTGATLTTLSRTQAKRIGLNYRGGVPAQATTANGVVRGWRVTLDTVRIGGVTLRDVDGMVIDSDGLPAALLGMSCLSRFDMQRRGSTLILRRTR